MVRRRYAAMTTMLSLLLPLLTLSSSSTDTTGPVTQHEVTDTVHALIKGLESEFGDNDDARLFIDELKAEMAILEGRQETIEGSAALLDLTAGMGSTWVLVDSDPPEFQWGALRLITERQAETGRIRIAFFADNLNRSTLTTSTATVYEACSPLTGFFQVPYFQWYGGWADPDNQITAAGLPYTKSDIDVYKVNGTVRQYGINVTVVNETRLVIDRYCFLPDVCYQTLLFDVCHTTINRFNQYFAFRGAIQQAENLEPQQACTRYPSIHQSGLTKTYGTYDQALNTTTPASNLLLFWDVEGGCLVAVDNTEHPGTYCSTISRSIASHQYCNATKEFENRADGMTVVKVYNADNPDEFIRFMVVDDFSASNKPSELIILQHFESEEFVPDPTRFSGDVRASMHQTEFHSFPFDAIKDAFQTINPDPCQ